MEVTNIKKLDDGSAELQLEMTDEEMKLFVSYAVNDILKKYVDKLKKENEETFEFDQSAPRT